MGAAQLARRHSDAHMLQTLTAILLHGLRTTAPAGGIAIFEEDLEAF